MRKKIMEPEVRYLEDELHVYPSPFYAFTPNGKGYVAIGPDAVFSCELILLANQEGVVVTECLWQLFRPDQFDYETDVGETGEHEMARCLLRQNHSLLPIPVELIEKIVSGEEFSVGSRLPLTEAFEMLEALAGDMVKVFLSTDRRLLPVKFVTKMIHDNIYWFCKALSSCIQLHKKPESAQHKTIN